MMTLMIYSWTYPIFICLCYIRFHIDETLVYVHIRKTNIHIALDFVYIKVLNRFSPATQKYIP